jgi:hypothetical protein
MRFPYSRSYRHAVAHHPFTPRPARLRDVPGRRLPRAVDAAG